MVVIPLMNVTRMYSYCVTVLYDLPPVLIKRTSVNIIRYDDIHGFSKSMDYTVKLVLFRYTIRASVTALAIRGDVWDGHNKVLKSKLFSETGVQCIA